MKPFSIESIQQGPSSCEIMEVRISGYLDAHTVDAFEQTCTELLTQPQTKYILDLGDLNYISSAGIGAMMLFLQQLRRREGDLVILQPSPKVGKVFDLLGFNQIFTITQDRDAARRALTS